jgi:hypothetical protein
MCRETCQVRQEVRGKAAPGRGRNLAAALGLAVALSACASQSAPNADTSLNGQLPSGSVEMRQVQAAFIGSGGGGGGTLFFRGQSLPFSVAGLGVGGFGVSTIEARGDVYHLSSLSQFPGAYAQGRYGFALGNKSAGDLWLQNGSGVVLHLKAKRTGLMLSLGGDAVVISMKQSAAAKANIARVDE